MDDPRRTYRHIVSRPWPGKTAADTPYVVLDEPTATSRAEHATIAASQLQTIFDRNPELTIVIVYAAEVAIGLALRDDYPAVPESSGIVESPTPPEEHTGHRTGEGDRATLPGQSQRYEAFRYACPQCSRGVYTTTATAPLCPDCRVRTT